MSSQIYKVVQWATGRVGMPALNGIIDRPDLQLVGLWVSPGGGKVGVDAGELCGTAPVGVAATSDVDALLALDADCVCYTATDVGRVDAVIDDLCRILASGKNVVNTAITRLVYPAGEDPKTIERLEAACQQGGSSLYNTGIHPGVVSDAMLYAVTNLSQQIESISAAELLDCSSYDPVPIHGLGFGKTIEEDAESFDVALLYYYWGPVVQSLAEAFDLEFDEVRHFRNCVTTEHGFTTSTGLEIPPGTIGAIHYGIEGVVNGKPRIIAENYERVRPDIQPEGWPMFPIHNDEQTGGYRVLIKGVPDMQLDLAFGGSDALTDALIGTGMRAVNSIPAVCEAKPGVIPSFEVLPHVKGFMTAGSASTTFGA